MNKILLIGSGWRANMWARLIASLPEVQLSCVLCRNEAKRAPFEEYGVPLVGSYEQAFSYAADAALVCVSKKDNFAVSRYLSERGCSVLCETPAGMTEEERSAFSELPVQIAEQYPLHPIFAAVRKVCEQGLIGTIGVLELSCCHGYHAAALMRSLLGTGFCRPQVKTVHFSDSYVVHAGRQGEFAPEFRENKRTAAYLDFGEKKAFYDWSDGQYFSSVRRGGFRLQGTCGELSGTGGVTFSRGYAATFSFDRIYDGRGGSLYPPDLAAINCLGMRVYENRYRGLRLSEEEIAMAESLRLFLDGQGYSARDGAFDAEIAQLMSGE